MFSIIQAAGWPIWLLLITSVFSLAIIIERFISLRRVLVIPQKISKEVISAYQSGVISQGLLEKLESATYLERLLVVAMRYRQLPRLEVQQRLEEAAKRTQHQLNHYLPALAASTTLAPLLGLFGTVVGMIEIFGAQNASGTNPIELAHGISVALYNTGLGLIIAIIGTVFYRYFRSQVENYLVEMEQLITRFLDYAYFSKKPSESL